MRGSRALEAAQIVLEDRGQRLLAQADSAGEAHVLGREPNRHNRRDQRVTEPCRQQPRQVLSPHRIGRQRQMTAVLLLRPEHDDGGGEALLQRRRDLR